MWRYRPMLRLRSHLTYANIMASVAVFVALGGSSVAAVSAEEQVRGHVGEARPG